ncbi:MAG: type I DNA topoisomerase [Phycisphaeraceae bacterium]
MAKKSTKKKSTKSTARKTSGRRGPDPKQAEGKHLVIVESPTKAKTINKYLGKDYFVMASVGHIRDLPPRNPKGVKAPVPGVDLDHDFEPTYEVIDDSRNKDTVRDLKKAAKLAEDVWFATDLDREGEAIAWHVAHALDYPIDHAKRVVFNAITKKEIEKAFDKPRPIETNRVDAQQARRILDRIVGYQVSPLLWKKVAGGLSAGRVQSVATRLVVEREREIEAFVPEEYWKLGAIFATDAAKADELSRAWRDFYYVGEEDNPRTVKEQNAWLSERKCLRAELVEVAGESFKPDERDAALKTAKTLGFDLEDTVETHVEDAKGPQQNQVVFLGGVGDAPDFKISKIETKRTTSRPSPPFITSTMQQQASTRLGFQLKRTMRVAQQLYEGIDLKGARGQTGLITYMRTDSTHLSAEALSAVRSHVESSHGQKYLPDKPNFFKSSNKDAQEAHEAIRPTDVSITPGSIRDKLNDEQFKLYDLIWRRFVACQMVPAQWDSTSIEIEPDGTDATFRATGRTLVFDGFLKVAGIPTSDSIVLPPLEEKQAVGPMDLTPTQHFTSPPARFNEASLQKKLEEEGIGRPSTYAAIIGTIQDRKYVETVTPRDKRLRATDMGKVVTDMLVEAFPKILDIGYTREMEAHLDEIESENQDWRKTLHEFYDPFKEALDHAHENLKHAKAETQPAPDDIKCPKCGSPTEYKFGKNGRFLSCTAFNVPPIKVDVEGHPGTWFLHKAKGKARPKVMNEDQSDKVNWTKLTKDDQKTFQSLSDEMAEPCKYAAPIDKNGRPMEPEQTDILCPDPPVGDGKPMIKRTGRFGPFLAAASYPDVQYIVKLNAKTGAVELPKPPPMECDIVCEKCNDANYYVRDSKRGLWLSCSSFPKCRGRAAFNKLDEDKQAELNKAWKIHLEENPLPDIRTTSGRVLEEGDEYVPVIEGEEEPVEAGSA